MEIAELQTLAEQILARNVEQLKKSGQVIPMFHLIRQDGGRDVVVIEGPLMNDNTAKAQLSRMVQAKADAGELQAVVFVCDVFHGKMDDRAEKIACTLGLNVEQAAAMGLCEKREAVMIVIDSPIHRELIRQEYTRDDGARQISLGPLSRATESDGGQFSGRMIDFFRRKPESGRPS